MCVGMGVPVHALQQDVVQVPCVQLYALKLAIVSAQRLDVPQDVHMFLVIHNVVQHVQVTTVLEIVQVLVPQTAQIEVVQHQQGVAAYAQINALDAQ